MNLCQPELSLDAQAMNARLTRIEDQLKSGSITVAAAPAAPVDEPEQPLPEEVPEQAAEPVPERDTTPVGFWTEVCAQVRAEVQPPASGFFAPAPNPPIKGILKGNTLKLVCVAPFIVDQVSKPEVLQVVTRKASARLGQQVRVVVVDKNASAGNGEGMDRLLKFGREHSDIVNIK